MTPAAFAWLRPYIAPAPIVVETVSPRALELLSTLDDKRLAMMADKGVPAAMAAVWVRASVGHA